MFAQTTTSGKHALGKNNPNAASAVLAIKKKQRHHQEAGSNRPRQHEQQLLQLQGCLDLVEVAESDVEVLDEALFGVRTLLCYEDFQYWDLRFSISWGACCPYDGFLYSDS